MSGRPLDVLEASLGEDVEVQLKGGEIYEGTLTGYDQHMNLVLEDAMRVPAAEEPAGDTEPPVEDTTIIRGDNVVSIIP
ncbi:LSM domain-containing protein [Natronoarchaeum sp. GCM10025703]|uniref:LSM domain-containing protein n=1 Tax=unclassified Natronoarchaeum TaxID=2620183 RepID=UPI00360C2152